jgi:hypothetical protein
MNSNNVSEAKLKTAAAAVPSIKPTVNTSSLSNESFKIKDIASP